VSDRVKPSFVILHPGTLTLSPERQSARMSKITNDDLTKYPHGNNGRQKVNLLNFNLEIKEFSIGNTVQR